MDRGCWRWGVCAGGHFWLSGVGGGRYSLAQFTSSKQASECGPALISALQTAVRVVSCCPACAEPPHRARAPRPAQDVVLPGADAPPVIVLPAQPERGVQARAPSCPAFSDILRC
jgi:hypothetical protein